MTFMVLIRIRSEGIAERALVEDRRRIALGQQAQPFQGYVGIGSFNDKGPFGE
jgi:hypothetical protein